jgi:hypothetical protein
MHDLRGTSPPPASRHASCRALGASARDADSLSLCFDHDGQAIFAVHRRLLHEARIVHLMRATLEAVPKLLLPSDWREERLTRHILNQKPAPRRKLTTAVRRDSPRVGLLTTDVTLEHCGKGQSAPLRKEAARRVGDRLVTTCGVDCADGFSGGLSREHVAGTPEKMARLCTADEGDHDYATAVALPVPTSIATAGGAALPLIPNG